MFKFKKKVAPKKLPSSQIIDVQHKELPHQTIASEINVQRQFSSEQLAQLLMHLALNELALGKSEEKVVSLLQERGVIMDVALLIVKKATASVVVGGPSV